MADMVTLETYREMENRKNKRIEELEKENAELKEKLEHRNCLDCSNHHSNIKLIKANLLLEDVYKIAMGDWNDPKWHDQVLRKTREYLKEIEK